jgi:hypothetical protein
MMSAMPSERDLSKNKSNLQVKIQPTSKTCQLDCCIMG